MKKIIENMTHPISKLGLKQMLADLKLYNIDVDKEGLIFQEPPDEEVLQMISDELEKYIMRFKHDGPVNYNEDVKRAITKLVMLYETENNIPGQGEDKKFNMPKYILAVTGRKIRQLNHDFLMDPSLGMTINKYYDIFRIELAIHWHFLQLKNPQIAWRLGYSKTSLLTRMFFKYKGVELSDYTEDDLKNSKCEALCRKGIFCAKYDKFCVKNGKSV